MTLNVYGWKTMPAHSADYAQLIKQHKVEVVGVQEGVEDWELSTQFPTDYSRAEALQAALTGKNKECWQRHYQIFFDQCAGITFIKADRFDLTDGPKATRTGEYAILEKSGKQFLFINVHWDHQNQETRNKNAAETAQVISSMPNLPVILVGDFNTQCANQTTANLAQNTGLTLIGNAGIDCVFAKGLTGTALKIDASPSDHPSLVAKLTL